METKMLLSCLNCGSNGTGVSTILSIETSSQYYGENGENIIHSRILINCGDSTQRFCGDNRIKLSRVCVVLLTSLAPHNISGLPGIILCLSDLGVGKLKIIGPAGLKNLLDQMRGFTNRRYPELDILEINKHVEEKTVVRLDSIILKLKSIRVANSSQSSVISLAVIFTLAPSFQSNIETFACIPLATFDTLPSSSSLSSWAKSENVSLVLFSPIQAISCESSNKLLYNTALKQCQVYRFPGMIMQVWGNSNVCEFQQAQTSLSMHKRLSPLTFPKSINGLEKILLSKNRSTNTTVTNSPNSNFKEEIVTNISSNISFSKSDSEEDINREYIYTNNKLSPLSSLSWHANEDLYGVYGVEEFTGSRLQSGQLISCVPLLCFRITKLQCQQQKHQEQEQYSTSIGNHNVDTISTNIQQSTTSFPHKNDSNTNNIPTTNSAINLDEESVTVTRPRSNPSTLSSITDIIISLNSNTNDNIYSNNKLIPATSISKSRKTTSNTSIINTDEKIINEMVTAKVTVIKSSSEDSGTVDNSSCSSSSSSSNSCSSESVSEESLSSEEENESNDDNISNSPYHLEYQNLTNAMLSLADRCDSYIKDMLQEIPPIPLPVLSQSQPKSRGNSTLTPTPLTLPITIISDNIVSSDKAESEFHPPILPSQTLPSLPPLPALLPLLSPIPSPHISNFSVADQLRAKLSSKKRSFVETFDSHHTETITKSKNSINSDSYNDNNIKSLSTNKIYISSENNDNNENIDNNPLANICRNCYEKEEFSKIPLSVSLVIDKLPDIPPPNPYDLHFSFLGTGSAKPSPHRSNSCILIRSRRKYNNSNTNSTSTNINNSSSSNKSRNNNDHNRNNNISNSSIESYNDMVILLDIGEGAASQLFQSVSGDHARMCDLLRNLSIIWISHHHADHHCGITMLLAIRASYHQNYDASSDWGSVLVVGPPDVLRFHEYVCCVSGLDSEVRFVSILDMNRGGGKSNDVFKHSRGHISSLRSIPVQHCYQSYGVVIQFTGIINTNTNTTSCPYKIVYSGDCRPSSSLITAGLNCDLLIHEATFDDSKQEDALCKRHSTISEAVETGVKMGAKHIILTHFSQRYPSAAGSYEILKKNNMGMENSTLKYTTVDKPFSVAFDFLCFSFPSQISVLPSVCDYMVSTLGRYEVEKKKK